MANRTVKDASSVKGTNPQYLVEKIIRTRIYESRYWKEECFALSAELLVDKAMNLRYVGGVFGGNIKPTPFLCLVLKMLQIQPEKDIIIEFIKNQDFKYVRALGAVYMRLVGTSLDCFKYLEPLYLDYRKLRKQNRDGEFVFIHMDEYIDELLREERACDCILPRIQKRNVLEETNQLEPRISGLDEEVGMESDEEEEIDHKDLSSVSPERKAEGKDRDKSRRSASPSAKRHRSRSPHRRRSRERDRDRKDDGRSKDRHRDRDRERDRRRSRSRDRDYHKRDKHKDRHRDEESDRHKHRNSKHSRSEKDKHKDRDKDKKVFNSSSSKQSSEIEVANALRAKLGLAPLRP